MVAYHLFYARYILQQSLGHQNTHLGFTFLLLFLLRMRDRSRSLWTIVLLVLSLIATFYIQFNYQDLDLRAGGSHTIVELIIGIIIIVLVFVGSWQEFGAPLPIVACIFLVYGYFGNLLPEPWTVNPLTFETLVAKMCMNMEGVYGLLLNISGTFVFLFMVFASLMTATGAVISSAMPGKLFRASLGLGQR